MSLFIFLTVIQAIVAAAMIGTILMQRSEGGGLGIGGSPTGLMSARGAADFLSRATKWLAVTFVALSIVLAIVAVQATSGSEISTTLDRNVAGQPDPLGDATAPAQAAPEAAETSAPADDPLAE